MSPVHTHMLDFVDQHAGACQTWRGHVYASLGVVGGCGLRAVALSPHADAAHRVAADANHEQCADVLVAKGCCRPGDEPAAQPQPAPESAAATAAEVYSLLESMLPVLHFTLVPGQNSLTSYSSRDYLRFASRIAARRSLVHSSPHWTPSRRLSSGRPPERSRR